VSDARATDVTSELMTAGEAASYLRIPLATLRYWRHLGVGPAGFHLGRRLVYRRTDLDQWISEQHDSQNR
jgi:excisionase family DNA binding protein